MSLMVMNQQVMSPYNEPIKIKKNINEVPFKIRGLDS